MGLRASFRALVSPRPAMTWGPETRLSSFDDAVALELRRFTATAGARPYRLPTVAEALGVPAIHSAVALISGTVGMLSMQGFRNGAVMDGQNGNASPPQLIVRPDPYQTPTAFYSGTAANIAKYGEFVWWIASRDGDGNAAALVLVPLNELMVQENPANRLLPKYRWGTIEGTRWSPANPSGVFVHQLYPLCEPLSLRGAGPLQLCNAATSVTVEAQAWAANFYAKGGYPREWIKKRGALDPTLRDPTTFEPDPAGMSEAELLKAQYVARDNNTPMVTDDTIEDIAAIPVNQSGAQMLEARQAQNGEAARMFRIPGSLIEYQQPGSSLTYQNLEGEYTKLVRTCLQPLYLEPIEQAMSDLLTRSTVARFNVKGFLRADVKTRYEVHGIAIDKGIYGPEYAQREEGILPGDVEFAPVPFAPPQAVPSPIRRASMDVRCPSCHKLIARSLGPGSELECPRCKTDVRVA